MIINSKQNSLVKYAMSIKDKKGVTKSGECLVESEKLVNDLVHSNHKVSSILVNSEKADKFAYITNAFKGKTYLVTPEICNYLADSVTPSGIFAFCSVPKNNIGKINGNFLVLENLQDPTNFGALVRSAKAFNFNNILAVGGVFPYSYKAIRSSMGYVFDVNFVNVTLEDIKNLNLPLFVGDMGGENIANIKKVVSPFGVAIGNEGKGVSDQLLAIATKVVSIPMQNGVESLNAAVSGGILMYHLNNIK